jgi:hypothetical protein
VPALSPADVRLKGSLHSELCKEEGGLAAGRASIEKPLGDKRQRLFPLGGIHSLKAAPTAGSKHLSTTVETRVETPKNPAQMLFLVAWTDVAAAL